MPMRKAIAPQPSPPGYATVSTMHRTTKARQKTEQHAAQEVANSNKKSVLAFKFVFFCDFAAFKIFVFQ